MDKTDISIKNKQSQSNIISLKNSNNGGPEVNTAMISPVKEFVICFLNPNDNKKLYI